MNKRRQREAEDKKETHNPQKRQTATHRRNRENQHASISRSLMSLSLCLSSLYLSLFLTFDLLPPQRFSSRLHRELFPALATPRRQTGRCLLFASANTSFRRHSTPSPVLLLICSNSNSNSSSSSSSKGYLGEAEYRGDTEKERQRRGGEREGTDRDKPKETERREATKDKQLIGDIMERDSSRFLRGGLYSRRGRHSASSSTCCCCCCCCCCHEVSPVQRLG